MDRKTVFAVAAIVFVLGMLGVRLWADGQRDALPSLSVVREAPDGRTFTVFGDALYIDTADARSQAMIPLSRFGVSEFHGDLAVLGDGSILLAQGRLPPVTVAENLQVTAGTANQSNTPSEPLMRCTLDPIACEALDVGSPGYRAGRTFRLAIDEAHQRILVSDTARHRLVLIDLDGRIVDEFKSEFRFPNQVQFVQGDEAVLADTWHHRLASVAIGPDGFGPVTTLTDIDCWPGSAIRRYPSGFAQLENGARWALVGTGEMMRQGLYRVTGECAEEIELPLGADALFLGVVGDTVLVPDAEHSRIMRFDAYGLPLEDFGSPALRARLDETRQLKSLYTALFKYSLWLLVFAAIPMIIVGKRIDAEDKAEKARPVLTTPGGAAPDLSPTVRAGDTPVSAFTPAEQLRAARHEHVFRRRLLPIDTEVAFRLLFSSFVIAYAVVAAFIWVEATSGRWDGLLRQLGGSDTLVLLIVATLVMWFALWLVFRRERLVVDRKGLRFIPSFPLYPAWALEWHRIARMELRHIKSGAQPQHWFLVIVDDRGVERLTRILFWRAAARDTGLALSELAVPTYDACLSAIRRTGLFRLLAPHDLTIESAVSAPPQSSKSLAGDIVLTTRPRPLPRVVRRRIVLSAAYVAAFMFWQVWRALDMSWPPDWQAAADTIAQAIAAKPHLFALGALIFVALPYSIRWSTQTLILSNDAITLRSGFPRFLKMSLTDWVIQRSDVSAVELLSASPRMAVSYKIRVRAAGRTKLVNAFQWYRVGHDSEAQVGPMGTFYRPRTLLSLVRTAPLYTALTEAGYPVVNETGVPEPVAQTVG